MLPLDGEQNLMGNKWIDKFSSPLKFWGIDEKNGDKPVILSKTAFDVNIL